MLTHFGKTNAGSDPGRTVFICHSRTVIVTEMFENRLKKKQLKRNVPLNLEIY